MSTGNRTETYTRLAIGAVAACVVGLPFVFAHAHLNGPPCLLHTLFHIPCPGCGLTRSLEALWRGDLLASLRYHPLGLPLFVVCWAVLLGMLLGLFAPGLRATMDRWGRALAAPQVLIAVGGLLVGVWLMRLGLAAAGNRFFWWDDPPAVHSAAVHVSVETAKITRAEP